MSVERVEQAKAHGMTEAEAEVWDKVATSIRRLVALIERHPDARTLGEALTAEGKTVAQVLGEAA
jgi:hypothetical protein